MGLNTLGALVAIVLLLVSNWLKLPEHFGAHPNWSGKVLFIGGALGILMSTTISVFASNVKLLIPLVMFDTIFFLGAIAAYWGKTEFTASYAENAFAGQLWFFGWIAVAAGMSGLVSSATRYYRSR